MTRFDHAAKWLRLGVILTAVSSVAAAGAEVTWRVLGHDRVIPPIAKLRPPAQEPEALPDLAPAQTAAIPQTLILLGVIVRDDPTRSLALLRSDTTEGNYRIGDEVVPGTMLTSISQNHVTVLTKDTESRLYFAGADLVADGPQVPTGAERLLALMTSGQGSSISEQVDAAARAQPVTTQDYIDMWRDRIIANPAEVLDTIGLVPGEKGYTIAEKHDVGVNRAGLRAGDIVTSVNGESVGNVDQDRELYDVIAASGLARIEVERNGRTIVMSFPLQ